MYSAKPAWAADGKAIVFSGDRAGIMNLWRVPVRDGRRTGPLSRVTLGQGQDMDPAVGRDGRSLVFASLRTDPDIWELSLDGSGAHAVTHGGAPDYPQLSPDGRTLLVFSGQTGAPAVWTVDLQGRYLSRLTPGTDAEPQARWSPDGKSIGYVRGARLIIQNVGSMSGLDTGIPATGSIEWSPDGKRIAIGAPGGPNEIQVYDVETRKIAPITSLKSDVDNPAWSPDGREIAFQLQRGSVREVWVVPAAGGRARPLTKDLQDSHPAWSPTDPDTILFLRDHKRIATVSVSTGRVTLLPWTPGGSYVLDYPSWSPDGKKIYLSVSRKTGDLYLLEGF